LHNTQRTKPVVKHSSGVTFARLQPVPGGPQLGAIQPTSPPHNRIDSDHLRLAYSALEPVLFSFFFLHTPVVCFFCALSRGPMPAHAVGNPATPRPSRRGHICPGLFVDRSSVNLVLASRYAPAISGLALDAGPTSTASLAGSRSDATTHRVDALLPGLSKRARRTPIRGAGLASADGFAQTLRGGAAFIRDEVPTARLVSQERASLHPSHRCWVHGSMCQFPGFLPTSRPYSAGPSFVQLLLDAPYNNALRRQ